MKIVSLLAAVLLFLAILHLPIGYYRFMRIGVTIIAIYLLIKEIKSGINIWIVALGIIGILFNPIFPIYFVSGLFFLIFTSLTEKK
jgi:hypothetical protein